MCDKCGCPGKSASNIMCAICGLDTPGAFKKTTTDGWAHLACAIWIPNTYVENSIAMSRIAGIDEIVKDRKQLICTYCRRKGNQVQCFSRHCTTAFHPLCAFQRDPRLLITLNLWEKKLFGWCEKHHPFYFPKDDGHADESPQLIKKSPKKTKKKTKKRVSNQYSVWSQNEFSCGK
eukprot:UN26129